MRRASKVDGNQGDIVAALRAIGASVTPTHTIGGGFPDLVCGFRGRSVLFEVKDPRQPPSKRRLTDDEAIWFGNWRGEAYVIETAEQAIAILVKKQATQHEVNQTLEEANV